MDILDDMGVSKLSAKVFLKVNYSFKTLVKINQYRKCLRTNTVRRAIFSWTFLRVKNIVVLKMALHVIYLFKPYV